MNKIAVLTGSSLLAHGIISNLRQSSLSQNMDVLDVSGDDFLADLIVINPGIVVVESAQLRGAQTWSLDSLFESMPDLIVLEINLENSTVQLIRSHRYQADGFAGFLGVLESAQSNTSIAVGNP